MATGDYPAKAPCVTHHYACDCREVLFTAQVQELRDKLAAADLQNDELRKSRDHWLESRQRAIEGGEILKKELDAANRLNCEYKKALEEIVKLEPDDDGEKVKYGRAFNQATDIADWALWTCTHRPMKKPEWSPELLKLSQEALKRQDEEKTKLAAMSPEEREKYLADWRKRFTDHLVGLGESELPI